MNSNRNNSCKGRLTVFAAVLVALMVVQLPLVSFSDMSDAADVSTSIVDDIAINVFDQDSEDYSSLAYLSDSLPVQYSATEWVLDPTTRYWYNVNSRSVSYGSILTYGMVDGISVDEIRDDVVSRYSSVFSGNFVIVQASCTVSSSCNVTINLTKNGVQVYNDTHNDKMERAGTIITSKVAYTTVLSVDNSAGADVNITDPRGMYRLIVKCNGEDAGSAEMDYGGALHSLGGRVVDASGDPISGAKVSFLNTTGGSTPEITNTGSVLTGDDGRYFVYGAEGEIVKITSIEVVGLVFQIGEGYSYGTVTTDVYPGPVFASTEHMIHINVTDADSRPASGVEISALWYTSTPNGPGSYLISVSDAGLFCEIPTDKDGNTFISINMSEMPTGAKLLIKGVDKINSYTFDVHPVSSGVSTADLPATVSEPGNVYADLVDFTDVHLKAEQKSVIVSVAGALDSSMAGGSPLSDVRITAKWYYQSGSPGGWYIRDSTNIESGTFSNLAPGYAWCPGGFTSSDGTVVLCYSQPVWSVASGESAYLYVYCDGTGSTSPSSLYTYMIAVPEDGTENILEQIAGYDACATMDLSSVTDVTLRSKEVAYTISGTITGTLPEKIVVDCISSGLGYSTEVTSSGSLATFYFTVMADSTNRIDINPVQGFSFSVSSQSMPTARSDQVFTSTSARSVLPVDRNVPVVIGSYTVNNTEVGAKLEFSYSVSGTSVLVDVLCQSSTTVFNVYGRDGNVVDGIAITCDSMYIGNMSGDTVDAYSIVKKKFVTYYNPSSDIPTIDNVTDGREITAYFNGSIIGSATSDDNGIFVLTVPDSPDVSYRFGDLSVVPIEVSTGPYIGYESINLKDVIEPIGQKRVTVTIRYIATSSIQNTDLPTNVDILNSPMMMVWDVGSTQDLSAPVLSGFLFSGWFLNGEAMSGMHNPNLCSIVVTESLEGAVLTASYSAQTPEPPKENIGTTVSIGMVSVTIAILSLIYVILQVRRY